jgi:hypothetical protein
VLAPLTLELRPERYPFWSRGRLQAVKRADLFARRTAAAGVDVFPDAAGTGSKDTLANGAALRLHATRLTHTLRSAPTGHVHPPLRRQHDGRPVAGGCLGGVIPDPAEDFLYRRTAWNHTGSTE